jgi:hypothetical protein
MHPGRKEKLNLDFMIMGKFFLFRCGCAGLLLMFSVNIYGQDNGDVHTEQVIEQLGERESFSAEDDATIQQYEFLLRNPVDINKVNREELSVFIFLSPTQIEYFLSYRKLNGYFISMYELQAVPQWNETIIRQLLPYITLGGSEHRKADFVKRWRNGAHQLVLGSAIKLNSGISSTANISPDFPGSDERAYIRYKYQYKNLLQYGVLGEKDAGEAWFKGAQRNGFDFYSAHLAIANYGKLKMLVIGDYVVNMGQGLLLWQSMAFRKSAEVMLIKRQSAAIRPYHSFGEYLFQRGIAAVFTHRAWTLMSFVSRRNLDATIRSDTIRRENYFSSINSSGLHRTISEQRDKGLLPLIMVGGNLRFDKGGKHIGVNVVGHDFRNIIQRKENLPYNLYAYTGNGYINMSLDGSYTYKNAHFFGEYALHSFRSSGWLKGVLMSLDPKVDCALLYRNISSRYQSLYGNAFTESTLPTNEKGIYMGMSLRPAHTMRIDMYADWFSFPWLRYGVDGPSGGNEYMIQFSYSVRRQSSFYIRFRQQEKMKNEVVVPGMYKEGLVPMKQMNIRAQAELNYSRALTIRNRAEIVGYRDGQGEGKRSGFLCFIEALYKPMLRPYSFNIRLQYFEADDYDSRVYAYEQDVMYQFSIPAFYGQGYRCYFNGKYKLGKYFTLWFRIAGQWQAKQSNADCKLQLQWQG